MTKAQGARAGYLEDRMHDMIPGFRSIDVSDGRVLIGANGGLPDGVDS